MGYKKRIEWIDLLRVFAIFGAVLCHMTEATYMLNLDFMTTISLKSEIFAFSMETLGRQGVPCFLMISGYLLLDREYDFDRTKSFWKNNWLHLLICTEIWFLVYEVFYITYGKLEISIIQVIEDLLFVHKIGLAHVWYMPLILGMYILVPFAAKALRAYEVKNMFFPVIFFSVFSFGYPFLYVICKAVGHDSLALQMSMGFSGGCYGIYFAMGYMIKKGVLRKIKSGILEFFAILSFAAGVWLQIWAYAKGYQYNIWYDCPFIFITSVAVFELFSRISYVPAYYVVKWLSGYSFAVYLIHMIIREVTKERIFSLISLRPLRIMILWLLVIVLSYFIAWLISKIPKIGKYILYIK